MFKLSKKYQYQWISGCAAKEECSFLISKHCFNW